MADEPVIDEEKKGKQVVYLMVPRKLIMTLIIVNIGMLIGIVGSYQYTVYIASQLCGVIEKSNDAYKANPNPSPTVLYLSREFTRLSHKYHCS